MNIEYLKTFVNLAQTKNFSTTAENLHVAQSTVSNRIKELEQYYGESLFVRTNKWVELTSSGSKLLPQVMRIIEIERQAKEGIKSIKYKSSIRIGTPHAAYRGFIKDGIKEMMHTYREVSYKVIISHTRELLEMLSDGLVDVVFASYLPKNLAIRVIAEVKEPIVLVARKEFNESDKTIHITDLCKFNMLQSDLGEAFENWVKDQTDTALEYALSIDQINEVIDYVINGFGFAFVPESVARAYVREKKISIVNIDGFQTYYQKHYLVVKDSEGETKALEPYLEVLRQKINVGKNSVGKNDAGKIEV